MNAHGRITEGLNEAIEFAKGKETGASVHRIAVPHVDVAGIRVQTGPRSLENGANARNKD